MSVSVRHHVLSYSLAASSFLAGLPAAVAQQNPARTGANGIQGQCLCLNAMKGAVSNDLAATTMLTERLRETAVAEVVDCGMQGGVYMRASHCTPVEDLRGPKGEPGEPGLKGPDGVVTWRSLTVASAHGGGGDGGWCGSCGTWTNDPSCPNSAGGSSSSGGGGKVVCGEFYRQGLLPKRIYAADLRYHKLYATPTAVRAYHAWAVPYVRLMRRSRIATQLIRPLASMWAHQMAFELGVIPKGPRFGALTTGFLFAVHDLVGRWLPAGRWHDADADDGARSRKRPGRSGPTLTVHLLPDDFWKGAVR